MDMGRGNSLLANNSYRPDSTIAGRLPFDLSGRFNFTSYFANYCKPRPKQITSFYVFGDSLSDTGNLSTITYKDTKGQFWVPPSPPLPSPNPLPDGSFNPFGGPYYSKAPYYNSIKNWESNHQYPNQPPFQLPFTPCDPPKVRASNGPIWADILQQETNLPFSNYAIAGANTGKDTFTGFQNGLQPFLPPPFYPNPQGRYILPGLQEEIHQFTGSLGCKSADPKALYVVWAGANDLFNLAGALPSITPETLPSTIGTVITTGVNNISQAIIKLAQKGAKAFLVPNLPNVGATPLLRQNNLTELFNGITQTFNGALADSLPKLEQQLGIDIIPADVYSLSQDILTGHNNKFTNVTDPLIAQKPDDHTINPDHFFWYDYQHPTTKVHEILANFFESDLVKNGYQLGYQSQGHLLDDKKEILSNFLGEKIADRLAQIGSQIFL